MGGLGWISLRCGMRLGWGIEVVGGGSWRLSLVWEPLPGLGWVILPVRNGLFTHPWGLRDPWGQGGKGWEGLQCLGDVDLVGP